MKTQRFIIKEKIGKGTVLVKEKELVHQIRNVFRMKAGQKANLIDSAGNEFQASIKKIEKDKIEFTAQEMIKPKNASKKVVLYQAVLKKENFELVIQKATEVGVTKIVPIITERTIKLGINIDRLKKIAKEAAEQSGHSISPLIEEPLQLMDAIHEAMAAPGRIFWLDTKGGEVLGPSEDEEISVFIGPEGGFSENERKLAKEMGLEARSLGNMTLRGETAAIIATYLAVREK